MTMDLNQATAARVAIKRALEGASDDMLQRLLCATFGHPPVVSMCLGQVTCGRCEAILGDTLAGVYSTEGKVVLNHLPTCRHCAEARAAMTEIQVIGTQMVR